MVRQVRTAVFGALAAFAVLAPSATALAQNPHSGAAVDTEERVAVVRIEVVENGQRVSKILAVRWGELARFEVSSQGRSHVIELRPESADGQPGVAFAYHRDGTAVQDGRKAVQLRKATNLFADDGTQVRVTVTPTKVRIATR